MATFKEKMNEPAINYTGKAPVGDYDFSALTEVDESSVEAKLFGIIDDIDTATDMFKPEIDAFEKFVCKKIKEAHRLIVSDGYRLFYTESGKIPPIK